MKYKNLIISKRFITSSYSCLFYLEHELLKYNTVLWAFGNTSRIGNKYVDGFKSFDNDTWYGKIPRIRLFFSNIHAFFLMMTTKQTVIINDLDFFIEAYIAKKLRKNLNIIHYNTELPGKDVKYSKLIEKFYKKHANFPDMIIECLPERALYRKKKWEITKPIFVINNTIPSSDIPEYDDEIVRDYVDFYNDKPILVFAGRCNDNLILKDLVDSMSKFENKINYLMFCHGDIKYKNQLKHKCERYIKNGSCKIYDAIPRNKLLMIMQKCNIGISFYNPNYSANYKYASPSKIYEYIACGLNIISSNNEGINHIIEDNKIGVCIKDNENIVDALNRLLNNDCLSNNKIKEMFYESLCYEVQAKETINELLNYVK